MKPEYLEQIEAMFGDAESVYREALEELKNGRVRKAAENAWCATAKATDALLLGRAEVEIVKGVGRTKELYKLVKSDPEVAAFNMVREYNDRMLHLHGNCFYEGIREIPDVDLEGLIQETEKYITNVKKLVNYK